MAVLFTGVDMPGEPQKAVLLRSGSAFTYSSGVFYAVCSGDLRGLTVRYGWDLYTRGYGLTVTEVWDMITSPVRLARWEVNTVPAPQPIPSPYPYVPVVPQPVAPPFPSYPYQPAPIFSPQPVQCGPISSVEVDSTQRVFGAAVLEARFLDYSLAVVSPLAGGWDATVSGATRLVVWQAPGCGGDVLAQIIGNLVSQGGRVSFSSAPGWVQSRFGTVRRCC